MLERIFVFGNIGKLSKSPGEGGQSSARRVIKGIEKSGYKVTPIVRHKATKEGRIWHIIETKGFALIDLFKIIGHLLFASRRKSAFMHLTYGGDLLPYEYIISRVVTMMGFRMMTYMKGGQFMDYYNNGTDKYRDLCRKAFDLQSQAWFEGRESKEIVDAVSKTDTVLVPNYIFEEDIPQKVAPRPADRINICYFGRIAPGKNTHVAIEAFNILCEKYPETYLTIVGGAGPSKEYAQNVDELINQSPYKSHITRKGLLPFAQIKEMLQSQHFFIFPSNERCEGHSNSLNEAMSQGVIPIVSNWHFNASVVGNPLLVVDGLNPEDFANRIYEIVIGHDLSSLADEMRTRIVDNFSYSQTNKIVSSALSKV